MIGGNNWEENEKENKEDKAKDDKEEKANDDKEEKEKENENKEKAKPKARGWRDGGGQRPLKTSEKTKELSDMERHMDRCSRPGFVSGAGAWEGYSSNPPPKSINPVGKPKIQWQPLEDDNEYFKEVQEQWKLEEEEIANAQRRAVEEAVEETLEVILEEAMEEALEAMQDAWEGVEKERRGVLCQAIKEGSWRMRRQKLVNLQRNRAARKIQTCYRAKLERKRAATKMQSLVRGFIARRRCARVKEAQRRAEEEELLLQYQKAEEERRQSYLDEKKREEARIQKKEEEERRKKEEECKALCDRSDSNNPPPAPPISSTTITPTPPSPPTTRISSPTSTTSITKIEARQTKRPPLFPSGIKRFFGWGSRRGAPAETAKEKIQKDTNAEMKIEKKLGEIKKKHGEMREQENTLGPLMTEKIETERAGPQHLPRKPSLEDAEER